MQKRAKTEGIGGGIPPDKICHRIFAFSGTLVIFKQRSKHATPVGLYIMGSNSGWNWPNSSEKIVLSASGCPWQESAGKNPSSCFAK